MYPTELHEPTDPRGALLVGVFVLPAVLGECIDAFVIGDGDVASAGPCWV